MKNVLNRIKTILCTALLCISIIVSGIGSSNVSAAVPGVTTYALWEMLLLTLGVTIKAEGGAEALEDICSDFMAAYENWWTTKMVGGVAATIGAAKLATNLQEYYKDGYLDIPLPVWLGLKAFINDSVVSESKKLPINGAPDLTECTFEKFSEALCYYYGIDEEDESKFRSFFYTCYQKFADDHSFILLKEYNTFYVNCNEYFYMSLYDDGIFGWVENSKSTSLDNIYIFPYSSYLKGIALYADTGTVKNSNFEAPYNLYNNRHVVAFCANGLFYNFYDIFTYPANVTSGQDRGPYYAMSDISSNIVTMLSDKVSTTINSGAVGSITDAYVNSGYDVLTPGREWDEDEKTITGNVTIGIPSEDVLEAYRNGTLTWDELLTVLDIHPVDTSTDKDIVTDTTIAESIDKIGDKVVTEVNSMTILLREVIDTITDGFASIKEYLQSIFIIDTVAIDAALSGFDTVWEAKVPFAGALTDMFNNFSFTENYEYPVISMKTPDILKNFYAEDLIILCDFANYAKYCVWCRNLVRALLWFSFGFSVVNHLKTDFHVG